MISSQQRVERIQKNVGVLWQSQRSDGSFAGILFGSPDVTVTEIVTSRTPTLDVLRKAVNSYECAPLAQGICDRSAS